MQCANWVAIAWWGGGGDCVRIPQKAAYALNPRPTYGTASLIARVHGPGIKE